MTTAKKITLSHIAKMLAESGKHKVAVGQQVLGSLLVEFDLPPALAPIAKGLQGSGILTIKPGPVKTVVAVLLNPFEPHHSCSKAQAALKMLGTPPVHWSPQNGLWPLSIPPVASQAYLLAYLAWMRMQSRPATAQDRNDLAHLEWVVKKKGGALRVDYLGTQEPVETYFASFKEGEN